MVIGKATLMGVACLLTHAPTNPDAIQAYESLNELEKAKVSKMVEGGSCIPSSVQKLIEESKRKDPEAIIPITMPCHTCS